MKFIDTDEVASGLYDLFKKHPELIRGDVALEAEHEAAAVALLLALTRHDWASWNAAPIAEVETARALLVDFFGKITHPRPGEMLGKRWQVPAGSAIEMALSAVAQEIAASHPQQTHPH